MAKNDDVSGEQVERLTDKEKRYDSEDAVLIIDGVEYDVLALWGHVEALEQALEASQQENERFSAIQKAIDAVADNDYLTAEGVQELLHTPLPDLEGGNLGRIADRYRLALACAIAPLTELEEGTQDEQ